MRWRIGHRSISRFARPDCSFPAQAAPLRLCCSLGSDLASLCRFRPCSCVKARALIPARTGLRAIVRWLSVSRLASVLSCRRSFCFSCNVSIFADCFCRRWKLSRKTFSLVLVASCAAGIVLDPSGRRIEFFISCCTSI